MVKLIVAKASNNAIGKDNQLIWHLPDEMKYFTKTTAGHVVVMGRKNWDSIPEKYRPLSGRINVVVTRNSDFSASGCIAMSSLEEAVAEFGHSTERDLYIIGGGQIYARAIHQNLVDEMLITEINDDFEADTFFPEINEGMWTKELIGKHSKDEKHPHSFAFFRYQKARR